MLVLGGAGLLLLSRKLHSRDMLGLVDWEVLMLFIGLFIVNDAFEQTGLPQQAVADLAALGINLQHPAVLYGVTFLLSNLVSNVPAIMLLLPVASSKDGALLALSSTFAGNLLVIGSIANIIVMDAAARRNVRISWKQHALVGVPVTTHAGSCCLVSARLAEVSASRYHSTAFSTMAVRRSVSRPIHCICTGHDPAPLRNNP